jgi:hypothetical protein
VSKGQYHAYTDLRETDTPLAQVIMGVVEERLPGDYYQALFLRGSFEYRGIKGRDGVVRLERCRDGKPIPAAYLTVKDYLLLFLDGSHVTVWEGGVLGRELKFDFSSVREMEACLSMAVDWVRNLLVGP